MIEKDLAEATKAALIAPAGCGKTHLIAQAVANHNSGRELILTHTHAGIDSLRNKLKKVGAKENSFSVETIAGFSLKYTSAYPSLSGVDTPMPSAEEWRKIYEGMDKLLQSKHIRDVLRLSYTGFYVDEYQDCSVEQHSIVLTLAKILPKCRILGDPLQGIFNFKKAPTINWEQDVSPNFEELQPLQIPHRWKNGGCSIMGNWLLTIRENFNNGTSIEFINLPSSVKYVVSTKATIQQDQLSECFRIQGLDGTSVCINSQRSQNYELSKRLNGGFSSLEPIDSEDLYSYCEKIETHSGYQRILHIIDLACECLFLSNITGPFKKAYKTNKAYIGGKSPCLNNIFNCMQKDSSLGLVYDALLKLRDLSPKKFKRDELFYAFISSLREFQTGKYTSLKDAAWQTRNKLRFIGRSTGKRILATTLLVKGLEFDHCLILNADDLKPQELYVAMTRGSKSLTIIGMSQTLPKEIESKKQKRPIDFEKQQLPFF